MQKNYMRYVLSLLLVAALLACNDDPLPEDPGVDYSPENFFYWTTGDGIYRYDLTNGGDVDTLIEFGGGDLTQALGSPTSRPRSWAELAQRRQTLGKLEVVDPTYAEAISVMQNGLIVFSNSLNGPGIFTLPRDGSGNPTPLQPVSNATDTTVGGEIGPAKYNLATNQIFFTSSAGLWRCEADGSNPVVLWNDDVPFDFTIDPVNGTVYTFDNSGDFGYLVAIDPTTGAVDTVNNAPDDPEFFDRFGDFSLTYMPGSGSIVRYEGDGGTIQVIDLDPLSISSLPVSDLNQLAFGWDLTPPTYYAYEWPGRTPPANPITILDISDGSLVPTATNDSISANMLYGWVY